MAFDITNPQHQRLMKEKLLQQGFTSNQINSELNSRLNRHYTIKGIQSGAIDYSKAVTQDPTLLGDLQRTGAKMPEPDIELSETERKFAMGLTAAQRAKQTLEQGEVSTGPVTTRIQKAKEFMGSTEGTKFRSDIALANTAIKSAFLGAGQSKIETEALQDALINPNDQEEIIKEKLDNAIQIVSAQLPQGAVEKSLTSSGKTISTTQQTGQKQQQTAGQEPSLSEFDSQKGLPDIEGVYYEDIKDLPKTNIRKFEDSEGGIDNRALRLLINYDVLPIAGSIIGGALAGGSTFGVGTLAGGAAGAAGGEALEQSLREIMDPDAQTLSDSTKEIIFEGITDAMMGGTFAVVTKGSKIVLKPVASKVIGSVDEIPSLIKTGLGASKTARNKYKFGTSGGDLIDDYLASDFFQKGMTDMRKINELAEQGYETAVKAKRKILSNAPDLEIKPIVNAMEESKKIFEEKNNTGAIKILDKYIGVLKNKAGKSKTVSAEFVNDIYNELGDQAFKATGLKESLSAKGAKTGAHITQKAVLESGEEGVIKSLNQQIVFNRLIRDLTEEQSLKATKAAITLADIGAGGTGASIGAGVGAFAGGPPGAVIGGGVGGFASLIAKRMINEGLQPLGRAKLITNLIDIGVSTGQNNLVNLGFRIAARAGINISAAIPEIVIDEMTTTPPQL